MADCSDSVVSNNLNTSKELSATQTTEVLNENKTDKGKSILKFINIFTQLGYLFVYTQMAIDKTVLNKKTKFFCVFSIQICLVFN